MGPDWKIKCVAPSCGEVTGGSRGFHSFSGSVGIARKLLVLISGEHSVVKYKNNDGTVPCDFGTNTRCQGYTPRGDTKKSQETLNIVLKLVKGILLQELC